MTKNGLRGFSSGIFVACALVALYYYLFANHSQAASSTQPAQVTLSQSKVDQFLTKHGEVAVDESTFKAWQSDQKSQSSTSSNKTSSTKNATSTQKASDSSSSNTVTKLTLHITGSMGVWDVAKELEKDKIIKDKQALYDYMLNHKMDKYLQLGTFTVSSNMTTDQIAKVITKNK